MLDSDEFEDVNRNKLAGVSLPQYVLIINARKYYNDSFSDFIVTNPRQIKHVENLGEFSPEDINIYHNLSPNIPEAIPPFPTEGKLGELREKEFALQ